MKLKPLLLIVLFCIANSIYAQIYKLDYQFNNHVSILNRTNTYNTTLVYDIPNKVSLYTVIKLKEKAYLRTLSVLQLFTERFRFPVRLRKHNRRYRLRLRLPFPAGPRP